MKDNSVLLGSADQFNTVFISYGRQQSLAFARKLHHALLAHGYSAWFDMNDIPLGVDFQDQIDDGIRKADNFIYIISPHAVQSEYCNKELALAVKYNKRIIPVLHVEPQTKTEWDKINEEIARRNWVQMKQDFEAATSLSAKALSVKGEILNVPTAEWLHIDNFEESFENLALLIDSHRDYVHNHTALLDAALNWSNEQNQTELLLVGAERSTAEAFLKQSHQPFRNPTGHLINPPCTPTKLMAYYVMESKKNGNNLQSDLFICHDASDSERIEPIRSALAKHGFSSWISNKDIEKGAEYSKAIRAGVIKSSNLLLFLSQSSLKSIYCQKEYKFALEYNKRIIPVLIDRINEADIDEEAFPGLSQLQYISFTEGLITPKVNEVVGVDTKEKIEVRREKSPFDVSVSEVLNTLNSNLSYHDDHRIYLVQATRWKEKGEKTSFLLRGFNLENAQSWLRVHKNRETYSPTELHSEFILASLAAKGQLGTEVFLSYSRKDSDFARHLNEQLQLSGKNTWFDQESISESVNFESEIFKGIAAADNFVFVISPDSVTSEYCEREVQYAAELNKRIITIKLRETDLQTMPETLRLVNWIDFEGDDFDKPFSKLIQAIEIDRDHARQHTVMQQWASEWIDNKQASDYLLNTPACENAEKWLEKAGYELPNIPHDLLLKEIQEKQENKTQNWLQRATKIALGLTENYYIQGALGMYAMLLLLVVGLFYFKVVIEEGFDYFSFAIIIMQLLFTALVSVWFYYKTLPVELPLRKRSFVRAVLNFIIFILGSVPSVALFIWIEEHKEVWELSGDSGVFIMYWLLGYFYTLFQIWLLLSRKRKRQRLASMGVTKKRNAFRRFIGDVYVQSIFVYIVLKWMFSYTESTDALILMALFYIFEIIPVRVFAYSNTQEKENTVEKESKRKTIITNSIWLLVGLIISALTVFSNFSSIDSPLGEHSLVLFFDYLTLVLCVYFFIRLKRWISKKKQKKVYETESIRELAKFYTTEHSTKIPKVSPLQIDYIHESRTSIAISKIELNTVQRRLQVRLRIAWGLVAFMILAVYSIFILSTEVKRHKKSGNENLSYFLSTYVLPLDTTYTRIELNNLNLINIPDAIIEQYSLKEIHITNSKLRFVSKEIAKMERLEKLNLDWNAISELPIEFKKLKQLIVLNLEHNKFDEIPLSILECIKLEELNMNYNTIDKLPNSIGRLTSLRSVYLNSNDLTELTDSIEKLVNLTRLELSTNKIRRLPAGIGNLSDLRFLNLFQNRLESIPAEIGMLTKLDSLDLGYNNILSLPEELSKLQQLKKLIIEGNGIPDEELKAWRKKLPNCDIVSNYYEETASETIEVYPDSTEVEP